MPRQGGVTVGLGSGTSLVRRRIPTGYGVAMRKEAQRIDDDRVVWAWADPALSCHGRAPRGRPRLKPLGAKLAGELDDDVRRKTGPACRFLDRIAALCLIQAVGSAFVGGQE